MLDSNMLFMVVLLLVVFLIFNKPIVEKFVGQESTVGKKCRLIPPNVSMCDVGSHCVTDKGNFTVEDGTCQKCNNTTFLGLGVPGELCNK